MPPESPEMESVLPDVRIASHPLTRWGLLVLGVVLVTVGLIGVVVPGLPTTVFLIAAVWAFSRSSPRFQRWLWCHPRLGPPLQNWYHYKVIPVKAKVMAISMMGISLTIAAYMSDDNMLPFVLLVIILVPTATYICTRASQRPYAHVKPPTEARDTVSSTRPEV